VVAEAIQMAVIAYFRALLLLVAVKAVPRHKETQAVQAVVLVTVAVHSIPEV
jgi:hypothetical protein